MSKTKKDSIWDKMFIFLWILGVFSIFLFLIFLFFKNIYVRSVLSLLLSYGFFEFVRTTYKDSIKDEETDESENDSSLNIFTLSKLLVIFNQSVNQREVSLQTLNYEKVGDIPTQDGGNTSCFSRFDSFVYSSNNVLKCDILKSNLLGNDKQIILYNDLTDQVVNAGFRKCQEKPHGNSYIITYKKGDIQIDFLNSDISITVSIYYVDRYFIGNLNDLNRKKSQKET